MEPTAAALSLGTKLISVLTRSGPSRARADLAMDVFDLFAKSSSRKKMSDRKFANELGSKLPDWTLDNLIPPVSADHIRERVFLLRQTDVAGQGNRDQCRCELRSELRRLYDVLTTTDPLTRSWRAGRNAGRTRVEIKALKKRTP